MSSGRSARRASTAPGSTRTSTMPRSPGSVPSSSRWDSSRSGSLTSGRRGSRLAAEGDHVVVALPAVLLGVETGEVELAPLADLGAAQAHRVDAGGQLRGRPVLDVAPTVEPHVQDERALVL